MAFPGHRQDLDEWVACGVERREDPHRLAHRPLRQRRLRGRPVLRHAGRSRLLPARRAHPPAFRFRAHLPDGVPYDQQALSDAILDLIKANSSGPATSVHSSTGATIRSASTRFPVRSMSRSWCGSGAPTSPRRRSRKGSTSRSQHGRATRRIRLPAMAKSVGELRQRPADQNGSDCRGVRRRHRARHLRQSERRQRPEHLHRARRRHLHPARRQFSFWGHHSRFGHHNRARPRLYVREETLPRETLYIADEVFFVGTAVEVTPIRSVDRIKVGRGRPRPRHRSHSTAVFPGREGRSAGYPRLAAVRQCSSYRYIRSSKSR